MARKKFNLKKFQKDYSRNRAKNKVFETEFRGQQKNIELTQVDPEKAKRIAQIANLRHVNEEIKRVFGGRY